MALELEQKTARTGSVEIEQGTLVVAVTHECIETENKESSEVVEDEVEEESGLWKDIKDARVHFNWDDFFYSLLLGLGPTVCSI